MKPTLISMRAALLLELRRGPGVGTELIERVSDRTFGAVILHKSDVYPELQALELSGLVDRLPAQARTRGRPRQPYQITPAGLQQARAYISAIGGLLS